MIVERPWGTYEVLIDEPNYKVKRIIVRKGSRFSLQYHHLRSEYWAIVGGRGYVQTEDSVISAIPGMCFFIPKGQVHRATSSSEDLIFIETQIGECNEDDIVRIEDDYGRVKE